MKAQVYNCSNCAPLDLTTYIAFAAKMSQNKYIFGCEGRVDGPWPTMTCCESLMPKVNVFPTVEAHEPELQEVSCAALAKSKRIQKEI